MSHYDHYTEEKPTGGCEGMFAGMIVGTVILILIVALSFWIARSI